MRNQTFKLQSLFLILGIFVSHSVFAQDASKYDEASNSYTLFIGGLVSTGHNDEERFMPSTPTVGRGDEPSGLGLSAALKVKFFLGDSEAVSVMTNPGIDSPFRGKDTDQRPRMSLPVYVTVQNVDKLPGIKITAYYHHNFNVGTEPKGTIDQRFEYGKAVGIHAIKSYENDVNVTAGYTNFNSGHNMMKQILVPGYLIASTGTTGFVLGADKTYKLGSGKDEEDCKVKFGCQFLWDIKGQTQDIETTNGEIVTLHDNGDNLLVFVTFEKRFDDFATLHIDVGYNNPLGTKGKITGYKDNSAGFKLFYGFRSTSVTAGFEFDLPSK